MSSWGTLSTCPGHRSRRAIFLPYKRFVPGYWLLMLTASQLVECKIIALDTEKRPLAERVIKKLNLLPKGFFCPPSCLLCLAVARPTTSLR